MKAKEIFGPAALDDEAARKGNGNEKNDGVFYHG
jgi:hypothetical protein